MKTLRAAWWDIIKDIALSRLVFLDESGVTLSMTRTHGRAAPGERVEAAVPESHWKVTTLIGAVRLDGVATVATLESATDGAAFLTFVREVLAPTLREGDVVVMDNLSSHKVAGVKEAIEAAGGRVEYLPPYSPDYNPIEKFWSKLKAFLRSAAARTAQALGEAITRGAARVTLEDILHWFEHCGYGVPAL